MYAFHLVFFIESIANVLNVAKFDCKYKEKRPKSKVLFLKAPFTSFDNWEFLGCTRVQRLAYFAIFHFRLFILQRIHIWRKTCSMKDITESSSHSWKLSVLQGSRTLFYPFLCEWQQPDASWCCQWYACGVPYNSCWCEFRRHVRVFAKLITGCSSDVIKTRLQVEARQGQTNYAGLRDAFVKICE